VFDYHQEQIFFLYSAASQICPGVHPSYYLEGTARPVPGIQRPGSEADHSHHFVPRISSTLDCATTSVCICMMWCLSIAGLIPQSLQLPAQVTLASLGSCHKRGNCAKSCSCRSVFSCSESGGGVSIYIMT
jgi:hypothetical protein